MLRRRISIVACLGLAILDVRSTDSLLIPSSFTAGSSTSSHQHTSRIQRLCNDDNISLPLSSCHNNNHHHRIQSHRKRSLIVCHMNKEDNRKKPNFFSNRNKDSDDEEDNDNEDQSNKRNVFKRAWDKVSGGNKKDGDNNQSDTEKQIGYKPSPLDGIRLNLARAMSGLSNINLFQWGEKEEWVVACPKTRVGPGQIIPCSVNGLDIIIFASRDGQRLDAFANACPHLGSPFDLATIERKPIQQGNKRRVDDGTGDGCVDCIVCPVHQTAFEIQSGKVQGEWCPYPPMLGNIMGYMKPKQDLIKFAVRLRGKNVEVRIGTTISSIERGMENASGLKGIK